MTTQTMKHNTPIRRHLTPKHNCSSTINEIVIFTSRNFVDDYNGKSKVPLTIESLSVK